MFLYLLLLDTLGEILIDKRGKNTNVNVFASEDIPRTIENMYCMAKED